MAIWLALYSGLMQFVMGAFRMGILANLVSNAVVQGFVNAAAIIIVLSQGQHATKTKPDRYH